tara:strand:- start:730 stop:2595 length:1866 start_codon:yes stop_codon:yes gene_type:complete
MQALYSSIIFNIKYFGAWVIYFVIARLIFLVYYFDFTKALDKNEFSSIIIYGLRLDLSIAGYLAVIPFLLTFFSVLINGNLIKLFHKTYSFILVLFLNTLFISDLFLYSYWKTRLDTTFLKYLNTPELIFASISNTYIILFLTLVFTLTFGLVNIFNSFFYKEYNTSVRISNIGAPVLLVLLGLLVLPIRGGLQTIPINQSNVYFSKKMFANHAAINYAWNFMHAIAKRVDPDENPFLVYEPEEASLTYELLKKPLLNKDSILNPILKIKNPNVIFIIWEGLTAKVVGPLLGDKEITPNINKLSEEGLLFTNFFANGDRTDKGLVALLSGYYPQPKQSIIKMPVKSKKLPLLTESMKAIGYENSFYYGGDLNFGNMNTYLTGKGIDQIYGSELFKSIDWNSKWGVHDHILFDRVAADFDLDQQEPFFKTILTLTSHEPYEFPGEYKFGNNTELNKFNSSMAYTDQAVGAFISFAKKQPWWEKTLVIITADHGHPLPKTSDQTFNAPSRFQIPMLWLGGALATPGSKNTNLGSQVDIAYTLLDLLDADNSSFKFGTHLFNSNEKRFAHYVFNEGFGTINNSGFIVYDFISQDAVQVQGQEKDVLIKLGKAILQTTYQDFLEK